MGGNAIKSAIRKSANEYNVISNQALNLIKQNPLVEKAQIIIAYKNKPDFGDIDILYTTTNDKPLPLDYFKTNFVEIVPNSHVTSVLYNEMQVDFIFNEKSTFDYAYNYFAYNDLGNLIGKIIHKFGLKHGHKGLTLPIRHNSHVLAELTVDNAYYNVLDNFGFDSTRFKQGFDNLTDIFDFVISSKYFNKDVFAFENMNAVARIRDKKRSTYNAFLQYIKDLPETNVVFKKDKTLYLSMITSLYPALAEEIKSVQKDYLYKEHYKTKINGTLITSLTGLSGKELGHFITDVINKSKELDSVSLFFMTPESINNIILKLYKEYND